MGYTSITKPAESQAYRLNGLTITEASQESFFRYTKTQAIKYFAWADVCDNGNIRLFNSLGDFLTYSKQ